MVNLRHEMETFFGKNYTAELLCRGIYNAFFLQRKSATQSLLSYVTVRPNCTIHFFEQSTLMDNEKLWTKRNMIIP